MMSRVSGRRMTMRALASAGVAGIALIAAVCADSPAEPRHEDSLAARDVVVDVGSDVTFHWDGVVNLEGTRIQYADGPVVWGEMRLVEAPDPYWVASGRIRFVDTAGNLIVPPGDAEIVLKNVRLKF